MIYEIENEETLSIYLYKLACIFLLLYNQVKIALKNGFFWYTHTQIKYLFIIIFFGEREPKFLSVGSGECDLGVQE